MEYADYDLSKLACEKLLGIDFSKRPCEGRVDPLNDWGVLGPLMLKYKIEIDYFTSECTIWSGDRLQIKAITDFESESEIPRAIIICILKSENII